MAKANPFADMKKGKPGAKGKKMPMKMFEKSPSDVAADKKGRHGKEGSAKDKAIDKKSANPFAKKR